MNDGKRILELLSTEGSYGDSPSGELAVMLAGAFFSRLPEEIISGGGFTLPELSPELNRDANTLADLASHIKETLATSTLSVPFLMTVESEAYGGEVEPPQGKDYKTDAYRFPLRSIDGDMKVLDPTIDGRLPVVLDTVAKLKSRYPETTIIADVGAPLAILSSLLDTAEILKAFIRSKKELHDKLERIAENTISYAKALVAKGAEIIVINDNFSTPAIVGDFFEEFTVPYINRIREEVRAAGGLAVVHICGEVELFGEGLNLLSTEVLSADTAASIKALRGIVGGKTLMAGVSHAALSSDNGEGLLSEVKRAVAEGARIITPSCGADLTVKVERLRELVRAACEGNLKDLDFLEPHGLKSKIDCSSRI
ncbi:MAG: hypothetical protein KAS88_01935 [Deltaproteobacteria bacterium]|nr:hypothetical protein [Deltaproteobacteria bacterium]